MRRQVVEGSRRVKSPTVLEVEGRVRQGETGVKMGLSGVCVTGGITRTLLGVRVESRNVNEKGDGPYKKRVYRYTNRGNGEGPDIGLQWKSKGTKKRRNRG